MRRRVTKPTRSYEGAMAVVACEDERSGRRTTEAAATWTDFDSYKDEVLPRTSADEQAAAATNRSTCSSI